jgi:hypothetical protein
MVAAELAKEEKKKERKASREELHEIRKRVSDHLSVLSNAIGVSISGQTAESFVRATSTQLKSQKAEEVIKSLTNQDGYLKPSGQPLSGEAIIRAASDADRIATPELAAVTCKYDSTCPMCPTGTAPRIKKGLFIGRFSPPFFPSQTHFDKADQHMHRRVMNRDAPWLCTTCFVACLSAHIDAVHKNLAHPASFSIGTVVPEWIIYLAGDLCESRPLLEVRQGKHQSSRSRWITVPRTLVSTTGN